MITDKDLAEESDLDAVIRAVARERVIRDNMARTGESRQVVAEMVDAMAAMDQEAVLDLVDGEPTTLRAALHQYAENVEAEVSQAEDNARGTWRQVASDLTAILNYPWSAEEERVQLHEPNDSLQLHIEEGDDRDLEIRMGSNRWLIHTVNWEDAGTGGQRAAEKVARAVHGAMLSRVIADRDHHVQINHGEAASLVAWAVNSSGGSWSPSVRSRLSVDAVQGGGLLFRTRPYAWQHNAHGRGRWNVTPVSTGGIRPHRPMTHEEAKLREEYAHQELARPISPERIQKIMGEEQ